MLKYSFQVWTKTLSDIQFVTLRGAIRYNMNMVLNAQQNHLSLTSSLQLPSPLFFFSFLFFLFSFASLFHLLFSLSLALIISIFYCLNYTSILLHLITTHLVSHLSLSSIIFSIPTLIIGIFYCFNCISLLLHLIKIHLVNIFCNTNICPRQLLWLI